MAKQIPCAGRIDAVFTPMTSPRELTSGPPELPGFSAASVWMMLSMSRPDCERSERPSALTTPAVTEYWKPYGLPMAMASWPTRIACESPSARRASDRWRRCGSPPGRCRDRRRPDRRAYDARRQTRHRCARALRTTWLLVSTKPSGVKMKPEPVACGPGRCRSGAAPAAVRGSR